MEDLEDEFGLKVGEDVLLDWSEGMGSEDEVRGTVEGISHSAGEPIVSVRGLGSMDFPQGRSYDAAPEWVESVDRERPAQPDYLKKAYEPSHQTGATVKTRCPNCASKNTKPRSSAGRVVGYRCRDCGETFNRKKPKSRR